METDQQYIVRRPRHQAGTVSGAKVLVDCPHDDSSANIEVDLIDFSRQGAQFRCAVPLAIDATICLRIITVESDLDVRIKGRVLWRRLASTDCWGIGCVFDQEVEWTALGELFLHDILAINLDR